MTLFKPQWSGPYPGVGNFPAIGLKTSGGNWFVDDANTGAVAGYAVSSDGINFFIDTAASSGLTLSDLGGNLFVTYP